MPDERNPAIAPLQASAILFALAYMFCHAIAARWLPFEPRNTSFVFLIAAPLLASLACAAHARHSAVRDEWGALALGMLLWAGGMAACMYREVFAGDIDNTPALGMLLFVLYGVPLTYMLASQDHDIRPLRLVDGVLAMTLGALFAVHTFSSAGWSGADEAGTARLRLMFDIENGFILLFALLRWHAADSAARRRVFRALSLFALLYAGVAFYINHLDTSFYGELADVAIAAPFALLAALAPRHAEPERSLRPHGPSARVIRAASPLMLPIALLVVSGLIVRPHPALAIAGFAAATLGYGLRSVLLQLHSARERERLDLLARIDALTGLTNRRHFDDALRAEWNRARRSADGLSLLLLDIDHFKLLNDHLGHPAGDACLRKVAQTLQDCVHRGGDVVSRYGGEEFAAILPGTSAADAFHLAERMRMAVRGLALPSPSPSACVTISIGVGSARRIVGDDPAALLHAADEALYDAKRLGRDRTAQHASEVTAPLPPHPAESAMDS